MNEQERAELNKKLGELRELVGKNVEAAARIDAIAAAATARDAKLVTLEKAIEELRSGVEERQKAIEEMQKKMRQQNLSLDPVREKRRALEILGMQARALMCRAMGQEMPARFAPERQQIDDYNKARAVIEEGTGVGALFIPTMLEGNTLVDTLEASTNLLPLVDLMTGVPTKFDLITRTGRSTLQAKRTNSSTAATASDQAYSTMSIDSDEAYILFYVDNWWLELSPFQVGALVLRNLQDDFGRGLEDWIINADGTASYNSLTGLLSEATYVTSLPGGKTAFADVTASDFRAAKNANLARGKGPNARWLLHPDVLGYAEDQDRNGKVGIVTYAPDGTDRIWRTNVIQSEHMPGSSASGAGKAFAAVGDMASVIVAIAGNGMRLDQDKSVRFLQNQTAMRIMAHLCIKRKPVNTLRLLKSAAQ
jgi:HK97 family phage major capsid protein